MISGRWKPELGGKPEYLDLIGLHNGLWDYPERDGSREIHPPLAEEWERQRTRFATLQSSQAPPPKSSAKAMALG